MGYSKYGAQLWQPLKVFQVCLFFPAEGPVISFDNGRKWWTGLYESAHTGSQSCGSHIPEEHRNWTVFRTTSGRFLDRMDSCNKNIEEDKKIKSLITISRQHFIYLSKHFFFIEKCTEIELNIISVSSLLTICTSISTHTCCTILYSTESYNRIIVDLSMSIYAQRLSTSSKKKEEKYLTNLPKICF